MRWLAMAIPVVMLLAVLWLDRSRKKRKAAVSMAPPKKEPEIASDDSNFAFYSTCVRRGFRYIGETVAAYVHDMHVRLPRDKERLFARVPVSDFVYLAETHGQRCTSCKERLFDFYVTRPNEQWKIEAYGPFGADRIGRGCGSCGKLHEVCEVPNADRKAYEAHQSSRLSETSLLRLEMEQLGTLHGFVESFGIKRDNDLMYY